MSKGFAKIKCSMKIKHNIIFIMKLPVNNTEPFHTTQCVTISYKIRYVYLVARDIGFFYKFLHSLLINYYKLQN